MEQQLNYILKVRKNENELYRSYSIYDIMHDVTIEKEIQKRLRHERSGNEVRWKLIVKEASTTSLLDNRLHSNYLSSPIVDMTVCSLVYTYLKKHLVNILPIDITSSYNSLETILKEKYSKKRQPIQLSFQFEVALLWRTLNVLLHSGDVPIIVDFFQEFHNVVAQQPALSLSSYWHKESSSQSIVPSSDVEIDIDLLPLPELNYLSTLLDGEYEHDPLGAVRRLVDTASHISHTINDSTCPNGKQILLDFCMLIGIKSGRASLMLHAVKTITELWSHGDYKTTLDSPPVELEIKPFVDIINYIKSLEETESSTGVSKDSICESRDCYCMYCSGKPYHEVSASVLHEMKYTGGILLSFGKADHGKLGHGDSQVILYM